MKGGKTEFFKQDCAAFSYFTQLLIPILGHVSKCTCAMYCVCVCGAGVGIHWFSKILLWVLCFVDLKLKCISLCRESIINCSVMRVNVNFYTYNKQNWKNPQYSSQPKLKTPNIFYFSTDG
jgi:hypothetical protein